MVPCCRILVPLFLLATAVSTLRAYPHQLAYFNEAAGGPENGWRHLLHSNLDWGQDLWLVKKWMKELQLLPSEVTLRSHFPYPAAGLIANPKDGDKAFVKWEILSANLVFDHKREGAQKLMTPSGNRLGFGLWAFLQEDVALNSK
jgi:hypothetical protein